MTRIALIDDQEMIRLGIRGILASHATFTVIGEASDGLQAVELVRETRPDVVLMDIRMPGIDGVEAVRRIRSDPDLDVVKILILTTFEDDHNVIRAIQSGAQGFLGKNVGPSELIAAIEQVAAGEASLSQFATGSLVEHISNSSKPLVDKSAESKLSSLTTREREVIKQVATGLTNEQVAANLFISPYTVKTHLNRAMTKSGSRDRSQLVILAFKAGLVDLT